VENTFWTAFATSTLAAFVTALGIYTIRRFADWGHRNTPYFMCFAAGVLISASFLHIIPKSFSMNSQAPAWLLAGFFGMHLFNRFVTAFVCEKDPDRKDYVIGIVPMLGIGLHSFIDGFIYSIAFTVSILTGYLATMGMVLHEFPEGIITYLLLVKGGIGERKAVVLAFLAAAAQRRSACWFRIRSSAPSRSPPRRPAGAYRPARWSTSAPRTCCRVPNRKRGNSAWSPWPAACWWRWSSSPRRPETLPLVYASRC
jgi:zinc and cadmium transporter